MKKFYPAIFTAEQPNGFSVRFPDVPGVHTQGETMEEAYDMAQEALGLMLQNAVGVFEYPPASAPAELLTVADESVVLISFDEKEYRNAHTTYVKKTLSLPEWLNRLAMQRGLNFSAVLRDALEQRLELA
ncbi:MAG: type II toxin-antitoxin system HicB family antitoxin [Oscillospiraceae bacterium]|jgi:predicted RNase H-like HicB family nuclease|nr:type II toxin-antitoxin system HicB family antitoxin [Oscillospiraceae bacterium]